ncbi:MAG: NAD(P)H-binding protein [Gammaproteobacteria bacterium]|nr:NAD(P)H-binding protein [Gammaproteobacteria bacterium]
MIVITGANGHLGRRLLRQLDGRRELRAVVRSERAARQVAALGLRHPVDVRVADYLDADAMTQALTGASHVVHLVGIIKESSTSSYAQAHEQTTEVLCTAAAAAGVSRVVYLSILGSRPDSANACLASKGAAEAALMQAPTPALVVRVPMVLGEGDYASAALGRRAGKGWNVLLRGASLEQPIYADDVIQAIVAGTSAQSLDNVAVDLAGPTSLTRADLTRRAAAVVGRRTRIFSVPLGLGMVLGFVLEWLMANPPVTRTMLKVLDHDDRVDAGPACRILGIDLTELDVALARCLAPTPE